jgi:Uncharacterized protein encoded in toxicity protection region of plasmid R478, contains von Willebrand factor (vWF) domain
VNCALVAAFLLLQAPFRSGVDLVEVDVSVMRGGTPVTGLTAANFLLTDNGAGQEISTVTLDRLPLTIILTLDISDSVSGQKLRYLTDAVLGLAHGLRPEDRVALVTFSNWIDVAVPLTHDASAVSRAVSSLQPGGGTSLNDALHVALQLRPRDRSRIVVLAFTDGSDNLSWITDRAIVDEARRAGIVVHAIEIRREPAADIPGLQRIQPANSLLEPLIAATGGRIWSATSSSDLRRLFTRALEEMRARYLLTFTPKDRTAEGWHDLKVTLKNARGDVTARPGYFVVPKEP